jgi:spore coat polysaccharide biosynthesis predicted glycosyltransferase SpsG
MTVYAELRVLFRAPAGPRRGFGHLVRCRSLARALGVRPVVAVRGGTVALASARRLGCDVVVGRAADVIRRTAPDVLIVDDPIAADARRWIRCARRAGCHVVTVHDLGLGARDGDLVVDGSIVRAARATRGRALRGPRFAILDPVFASPLRPAGRAGAPRVLIALGGGPRVALARAIAQGVRRGAPHAQIRIAGGFAAITALGGGAVTWTGPLDGLADELARCDVAVVGGGVSVYEACARRVAAVAVPVVDAQRPTVRGVQAHGVARGITRAPIADQAAREVLNLLAQPLARLRLAARGRRVFDGAGAARVADAVRRLVQTARTAPHAATTSLAGAVAGAARRAS